MPQFAVIEAPSGLGLRALGVEQLPSMLKAAGLMDGLNATDGARIAIPPHDLSHDPQTTVLHQSGARDVALRLADAVGSALDQGLFPLVLGGDCSIEIGNMLA